jgi:hypothetical protein
MRQRSKPKQLGQSTTEYAIVCALAVLVLVQGGDNSAINQVVKAAKKVYTGFYYAINHSTTFTLP